MTQVNAVPRMVNIGVVKFPEELVTPVGAYEHYNSILDRIHRYSDWKYELIPVVPDEAETKLAN